MMDPAEHAGCPQSRLWVSRVTRESGLSRAGALCTPGTSPAAAILYYVSATSACGPTGTGCVIVDRREGRESYLHPGRFGGPRALDAPVPGHGHVPTRPEAPAQRLDNTQSQPVGARSPPQGLLCARAFPALSAPPSLPPRHSPFVIRNSSLPSPPLLTAAALDPMMGSGIVPGPGHRAAIGSDRRRSRQPPVRTGTGRPVPRVEDRRRLPFRQSNVASIRAAQEVR